jgi:hypothetical protein
MLWKLNFGKLDSTVLELNMRDIRTVRAHVQYDSATMVRWSPDSKALLIVRALGNNIEIYKVIKKPESGALPSVQPSHAFEKVIDYVLSLFSLQVTLNFPIRERLEKLTFWPLTLLAPQSQSALTGSLQTLRILVSVGKLFQVSHGTSVS